MAGEARAHVFILSVLDLLGGERRAGIIREEAVSVRASSEHQGGSRERQSKIP
jgi:hypothetical protein